MLKAKEISLKNMAIFLVAALAVTAVYYLARPHQVVSRSVPVFVGEEVLVRETASAERQRVNVTAAVKGVTTVKPKKVVIATKAETAPVPNVAAPLPIFPPSVTLKVLPLYPSTALEKGLEGTVILAVYIGLSGKPEKTEVKVSSGVSDLDQSAIEAVSQWRFAPASQGGTPIACWFEIPVSFRIARN